MKKKLVICLMITMVHRLGICATEKKSRWLKGLELEAQIPDPQPYDLEQIIFLSLSELIYRLAIKHSLVICLVKNFMLVVFCVS